MRLDISSLVSLGRGPEKTMESDSVLEKAHTKSIQMLMTSDWRSRMSLRHELQSYFIYIYFLPAALNFETRSAALATGIHLTVAAGVEKVRFCCIELPITRVGFSV